MCAQATASTRHRAEREFPFDDDDFRRIAAMLYADAGIYLSDQKRSLVYSRLAKRLRELGLDSFKAYCRLVASEKGADERKRMLAALTTNVTRFFREAHHFDHLKAHVLPSLVAAARRGARVRMWSAGCSRGQEPYTLAMTILSLMPDAASHDVRILATDIDPDVLEVAESGLYDAEDIADVPKADRERAFEHVPEPASQLFSVNAAMRKLIAFRRLNLVGDDWPMRGKFDVIFCRNVVIYFDAATQEKIWSRYADRLVAGGHLCIGHSERLSGPAQGRFVSVGTTIHQLVDEPRA